MRERALRAGTTRSDRRLQRGASRVGLTASTPWSRSSGSRRLLRLAPLLALAPLALPAMPARAGITGVCPDGSIFIVQEAESIPCRDAKRVEPGEVPPLRPEYLPRPYPWRVYEESADPDNPYNLVDPAREIRELQGGTPGADSARAADGSAVTPPVGAPPHALPVRAAPSFAPDALGLTDGELRDLFLIVELAQDRAPARFVKESAAGDERLRVSLAHSDAFHARFEDAAAGGGRFPGRRVILFSAAAHQESPFHANFTFTQGHFAFQPDAADPHQLGVLYGSLGVLGPGGAVLGYVVLPDAIDLAAPLDIYWNDRRTTATLIP